jgi:hypothetical protein
MSEKRSTLIGLAAVSKPNSKLAARPERRMDLRAHRRPHQPRPTDLARDQARLSVAASGSTNPRRRSRSHSRRPLPSRRRPLARQCRDRQPSRCGEARRSSARRPSEHAPNDISTVQGSTKGSPPMQRTASAAVTAAAGPARARGCLAGLGRAATSHTANGCVPPCRLWD